MSKKITDIPKFTLWLEFEAVEPESWGIYNEQCNIHVDLEDGRHYGLNIWTFDFFKTTSEHDSQYIIPPDLFVKELTLECIEATIQDLLQYGDLEKVLNKSI
ncbi:hypothetical protein [Chryseobacterium sp. MMS23-Vi53]|uniref:hypothetical protein n=1 Tax=Chryseobacterium sp. MMS23-Vi53 TaxID=3386644 RepID=UPI0039EADE60